MARVSYSLTDDNRRRLEILTMSGPLDYKSLRGARSTMGPSVTDGIYRYTLNIVNKV